MDDVTDVIPATIPDTEASAIEEALFLYYSGKVHKISDALTQVKGISVGTYYSRLADYPENVLEIQKKARARACEYISGQQQALEAEAIQFSKELQLKARTALECSIDTISRIARGEPQTFDMPDRDKDGKSKTRIVVPYPRDIAACARLLHEIARSGVLPEVASQHVMSAQTPTTEVEKETPPPQLLPGLGIAANFSRVTAVTPDGTEYTTKVKHSTVVDAEVIEDE